MEKIKELKHKKNKNGEAMPIDFRCICEVVETDIETGEEKEKYRIGFDVNKSTFKK